MPSLMVSKLTRDEFEAFWLPKLNETARRHGVASVNAGPDLDELWRDYLRREDDGLQERAEALHQAGHRGDVN